MNADYRVRGPDSDLWCKALESGLLLYRKGPSPTGSRFPDTPVGIYKFMRTSRNPGILSFVFRHEALSAHELDQPMF